MNKKTIIVLGMHRSRTSLVANILKELGVFMGNAFRQPDEHNPHGYWEDLCWRNINKTILNASGNSWWNPTPSQYAKLPGDTEGDVISMADAIARYRDTCYPIWGFKDPRTSLTIGYYHNILRKPSYVYVKRNRHDVVTSLEDRALKRGYNRPYKGWYDLCTVYDARAAQFLDGIDASHLRVISDRLLINPLSAKRVVTQIAAFVGLNKEENIERAMKCIVWEGD